MAAKLSKVKAAEKAKPADKTVVRSYAGKIAVANEEKNQIQADLKGIYDSADNAGLHRQALKLATKLSGQEAIAAQAFLRALNHYAAVLGVTAQTDMLDQNATTKTDSEDTEQAQQIAFDQGHQVGKSGGDLLTNPYDDADIRRAAWASGWRQGQTDLAVGLTPKGEEPPDMPIEEMAVAKRGPVRRAAPRREGATLQ